MGSYTFKWEQPAVEVFVTGTFDDWAKSVKLDKKNGAFEKTVALPVNDEKVLYKFVVDGNWTTSTDAPQEDDGHGIYNNVLLPSDIAPSPSAHIMSSAAPESTTAQLAAEQPKETPGFEDVPGGFIETPANEAQSFSVNPIPASNGDANPIKLAPGEKVPEPSTIHANTVESTVKDDEELKAADQEKEQAFGVSPLPATETAGNPITLAPGEPVPEPSSITANNVHSHVTLDKESYEKGESLPPQLGPVVTPEKDRGTAMFDIPGITSTTIPESSLPIGSGPSAAEADPGVTIQSAHPVSTTAALAAEVPKEPRGVPEVVSESQNEAGAAPEASADATAVEEKKETEKELLDKVPEQPATSENATTTGEKVAAAVTGGVVAAGAAAAGAATAVSNKASEAVSSVTSAGEPPKEVPETVSESIEQAHSSPEAAANPEAVSEKADVEKELLQKVPESSAVGQSAEEKDVPAAVASSIEKAHESPEAAANAEAVTEKKEVEDELLKKVPESNANGEPAPSTATVPDVVKESIAKADESPEAATNPEAVQEKKAVESELKTEVKPTDEIADVAPTESAALSATAPEATTSTDISPKALGPEETLKSSSEPEIPETTLSVPPSSDAKPTESAEGLNASADKPAVPESSESKPAPESTGPTTTEQTVPTVTTGAETTTAPAASEATETPAAAKTDELAPPKTPAKSDKDKAGPTTPGSAHSDKKAKRRSWWGKLKDKFTGNSHSAKDAPKDTPAKNGAPKDAAPATDAPASDPPATDAPASDAPASDAPAKDTAAAQ